MQKSKELCPELRRNEGDTGDVAARPTETGDEPEFDRVAAGSEDDRDGCGRRLGCNCRWGVMRSDHCYLTPDQIGCEVWQSIGLGLRPAILDRHVLALGITGFTNALPECAVTRYARSAGSETLRNPMVGSFPACCARAVSGHVAAPPSSAMNSRLFTRSPRRRGRAKSTALRGRAHWQS